MTTFTDFAEVATAFDALAARVSTLESGATKILNDINALQTGAGSLTTEIGNLKSDAKALSTEVAGVKAVTDALRDPATGLRDNDVRVLRALTDGELRVRIISYKGYALDNYYGGCDDGDGDRTVQFQKNDASNPCLNMTLKIVP